MNRRNRGVLIGMVLGDGYISVRSMLKDGKYPYVSSELCLKHSIKQREYLEYKASLLKSMFGGTVSVKVFDVVVAGVTYKQCRVSKSHRYFRVLHRVMYSGGKKTITRKLLNWLTPHGIAIWYMDDGFGRVNRDANGWVSSCSTEIATCCSREEAEEVQLYFRQVHDIEVKLMRCRGDRWSIRMNTSESQKFARLIAPYVIPHMRYKLAHVANLNVHECRTHAKSCVVCGKLSYNTDRKRGLCDSCYYEYRRSQRVGV